LSRKHKKKPESEVMTVLKKIGQDIAGQMPAVDKKRLLMMNIPYVIVFYLADKLAWLYRFCVGESAIERLGVLFLNFQMAFSNPILSLHIFDMAVGMITTVVIKAMVYLKGKNAKKIKPFRGNTACSHKLCHTSCVIWDAFSHGKNVPAG